MPIVSVFFHNERWFHFGSDPTFDFGSDYSTGPVHTTEFELIPATLSVHTAISAVTGSVGLQCIGPQATPARSRKPIVSMHENGAARGIRTPDTIARTPHLF